MRTKILILLFLAVTAYQYVLSQTIPSSRTTDWTDPGVKAKFSPTKVVSLVSFGADSTGLVPSDHAFKRAIASAKGGKVKVSKGTYLFNEAIELPDSIIIEGSTNTNGDPISKFLLATANDNCIKIAGSESKTNARVSEALNQGQKWITFLNHDFVKGDIIKLNAMDDSLLVKSTWAIHSTGQIFEVTEVNGNKVLLNKPLRRSYSLNHLPEIVKVSPRRQVHIQSLVVESMLKTSFQTAIVLYNRAIDCSITGIESYKGKFAHVEISNSMRISIEQSYFKDAHSYGGGGEGYGIALQYTSGDCYIHSNKFEHLRHSILLQAGANGNVVAYNYSISPYWTGTYFPSNSSGDLVLHGNYVYMNLFEGNVVQNIVIDNSHGINGPNNTFYRNRAELYGIVMNSNPSSNSQNFMGNQVSNTTSLKGMYSLQGKDHFQFGNIVRGVLTPSNTTEPSSSTMFNYTFSPFYTTVSNVPPIKTNNWTQNNYFIESQETRSENFSSTVITAEDDTEKEQWANTTIFPNPFLDKIEVKSSMGLNIQLLNAQGIEVKKGFTNTSIETKDLVAGIYYLKVESEKNAIRLVKQ